MDIKNLLKKRAGEIDKTLDELMNIEKDALSEKLVEAMKYTLFSGGKRVRPFLTIETAELVGGNIEVAKKVGAALELIHTYSLIHDDLPAMDDDRYRRGKLTNHVVFGSGMAILAGDGLLSYAYKILCSLDLSPDKVLKIIDLISDGIGYMGMVGGQALDLDSGNRELNLAELEILHRAKTGALFKCSIITGAYCGSPTNLELQSLTEFSSHLGLTFQIIDDILDITGDEEKLGKSVGRDQELNKTTYPILLGIEKAREIAQEEAKLAQKALADFGQKAQVLLELLEYILYRQS